MGLLGYHAMPSLRDLAHESWRMVIVYIYYITAARNSISLQLGTSCRDSRYGKEKAGGTVRPSRKKSHLPGRSSAASQAGRRVEPAH